MCDTRTLFARHGIRCTEQRVELYESLCASRSHPTAEELFWLVKERRPGLSLATVYNTLEAFCRRKLCRKIPSSEGGARYDADLSDHLHLTTSDGHVRDVPDELGARLLESFPRPLLNEIERRMGVRILRVSVELVGDHSEERISLELSEHAADILAAASAGASQPAPSAPEQSAPLTAS